MRDVLSIESIRGYHAHIYFSAETEAVAAVLRERIDSGFDVVLGRWHRRPVGPHTDWSYQVAFAPSLFATFVPWLALNRSGLSVLVHPETGDALADHRDSAIWLGPPVPLNLDVLART